MENQAGNQNSPSDPKVRAIGALITGSDVVGAAGVAGIDPETLRAWIDSDPEFIAGLNRAKVERAGRIRAEVRELAADALSTLRALLSDPTAPPAVRLRASLAILQASDAMKAEAIGPTNPREVRSELSQRDLFAGLGF